VIWPKLTVVVDATSRARTVVGPTGTEGLHIGEVGKFHLGMADAQHSTVIDLCDLFCCYSVFFRQSRLTKCSIPRRHYTDATLLSAPKSANFL
jgi:hypothetical protein